MPLAEFDFNALKKYITSSEDETLRSVTEKTRKKYFGSTSSMTHILSQFHYLLSAWRPVNIETISRSFQQKLTSFTSLSRAPSAIFLHYKDGTYAIDADKEFDSANVLMDLGKSMEKQLTLPKDEYERYRRSSENKVSAEEESRKPEAYRYSTLGDFVMRSQLDAHDPRLPGTGTFDLKTRAVVSIRSNVSKYKKGMGYEIRKPFGNYESYEREFYDMIRTAFLKYSLQVRMGQMDGIFVAFHNIERIFGFQYFSLSEIDRAIQGQKDMTLGNREFKISLELWNVILDYVTDKFPKQSLRIHFRTLDTKRTQAMDIFAEPVTEEDITAIQTKSIDDINSYRRKVLNLAAQNSESESSGDVKEGSADNAAETKQALGTEQENGEPETNSDVEKEGSSNDTSETKAELQESGTEQQQERQQEKNQERQSPKNVLGLRLFVTNKVNGFICDRPVNLKSHDKWSVGYELCQMKQSFAKEKYIKCMNSRKYALTRSRDARKESRMLQKLYKLAEKGRKYRRREDLRDQREGIVVLGEQPFPSSVSSSSSHAS